MVSVTSVDGFNCRSTGLELPRDIRFPKLAWYSADDGDIMFVGHFQHVLRPEAPSCGIEISTEPVSQYPKLTHIIGRGRTGLACGRVLLHSHSTLGACRESSIARSLDDFLRSWMGKSRTVLLDRHRRQCRPSAWSRCVW